MASAEFLKKPYARLVIPDEDGTFTAEIVEFPGCIAVGGTAAEALTNLDEVAADWIAAALEQGQDIPEPMDAAGFSGKLVLRMSKGLHRRAALLAEREGASLNQFIVTCLAEAVGERSKSQAMHIPAMATFAFQVSGIFAGTANLAYAPQVSSVRQIATRGAEVLHLPELERRYA